MRAHLAKSAAICFLSGLILAPEAHAFFWWGKKSSELGVRSSETKPEPRPSSLNSLSLVQAYEKALKRSESVAITAEEIAQAQARFYRAFDYFLPTVHYEMTRYQQDVDDDASSGGQFNFGRQRTPEKKFVFSQPLFSGFKEIAALQGSGADKKAQWMKFKRAKELLYVDVMEAYYSVLNSEKDVQVLEAIHELMSRRLKDLKVRVDLGRSRESESKTTLTDVKILESDLIDAKKDARVARNLLEFYLGETLDVYVLVEDNGEVSGVSAQSSALEERSDIISSEQEYIVAQKKVISANAGFFPTITLDGNYYTQRVGFQSGNDWDVTLKFDVPVFEVAQTLGDVKEAASNREIARLTWEGVKRTARLDARNAREELLSSQNSEKALAEADRAAKENYEILQKEYNSNLVNNLEVLDALRRYQDVEKRYQEARYTTKKNYWKLKVTLGDMPGVGDVE